MGRRGVNGIHSLIQVLLVNTCICTDAYTHTHARTHARTHTHTHLISMYNDEEVVHSDCEHEERDHLQGNQGALDTEVTIETQCTGDRHTNHQHTHSAGQRQAIKLHK